MDEEFETEEVDSTTPLCVYCAGNGTVNFPEWDEDGNPVIGDCPECGGTGINDPA